MAMGFGKKLLCNKALVAIMQNFPRVELLHCTVYILCKTSKSPPAFLLFNAILISSDPAFASAIASFDSSCN